MKNIPVERYMTPHPHSIRADESLKEAEGRMAKLRVRDLPVLDGEEVVGVLSERDVRLVSGAKADLEAARVEDACVDETCAVASDTSLWVIADAMAERRISAVLVLREGKVVGVFTMTDACRALGSVLREASEAL